MSEESTFYELNLSTSSSDISFDKELPIKSTITLSDDGQAITGGPDQQSLFKQSENNNNEDINPEKSKITGFNQRQQFSHFSPFFSFSYNFHRNSNFTNFRSSKHTNSEEKSKKKDFWGISPSAKFESQVDEALFTPVSLKHKIEFSPSVLDTEQKLNEENSIQKEIQSFFNPGETFIKLKAKKHLDHDYIKEKLQKSGPIISCRSLSYTSFIVKFPTHTMAIQAMNRINDPSFMNEKENPNHIQYRATLKSKEEINGLLTKRQHDLETTFSTPKCLCVHGIDPQVDNIDKLMHPFNLDDRYEIVEKNGEIAVYTYHLNVASVKDFLGAFQDNLSGVPNTYVTEEPNRRIIQKICKVLSKKLIIDCIEDVKKLLSEDVIIPAINEAINEDESNNSIFGKNFTNMNNFVSKSMPLVQPEISMPFKSAQNLQSFNSTNETQIKRSNSNPLDFYRNHLSNFQGNNAFNQLSLQQKTQFTKFFQQMHNLQQIQYQANQKQFENRNETDQINQKQIFNQQQQFNQLIQQRNQNQFMNYNVFYPPVQQQQQQQQNNPYLVSFQNQQQQKQLFQQKTPKQTKQSKTQKMKENHSKQKQNEDKKVSRGSKLTKGASNFQKNTDTKELVSKSTIHPQVSIKENQYEEKGRYLNFYLGSRSNLNFYLSAPKTNFSSLLRNEVKRRKKQLLFTGNEARHFEREMARQMEQETTFESIKQPSIENNSSRLTPIHKIEEWHKRVYLRPYASMRRKKYIVARKSGLPILKTQFQENINEISEKKGNVGKRVYFEKSEIQGYGLFALEPISPKDFICEYTGQLIRMEIADRREKKLTRRGFQHMYLFRIGQMVIDATEHGSNARFLNHSCSPNCRARQITIKDMQTISFFATKSIKPHDEIAFNYEMELESDPSKWEKCYCGSKECNGYLNYSFRRSALNKMWLQANNLDENSDDSA